jgi:adenylate kinase
MYIVLLGAPGAGKGTQAETLISATGLPQIASGDLFRAIRTQETELAQLVRSYYDQGQLVPDALTIRLFLERLAEPDCSSGCLLDGFPRTLEQARALDAALGERHQSIDRVLYLIVSEPELLKRLAGRLICRNNGLHVFHEITRPPKVAGVCDECGGELYQRVDDKIETARERLHVFFNETLPLVEYYRVQGKLAEVNGEQAAQAVGRDMLAAIGQSNARPHTLNEQPSR